VWHIQLELPRRDTAPAVNDKRLDEATSEQAVLLLGPAGLSVATITRLTAQWQDDAKAFAKRSLTDVDDDYMWVDRIHLKVRRGRPTGRSWTPPP
jgi:hypothetical protein